MPPEIAFALGSLVFLGANDFLYKWGQRFGLKSGPFMLLQNFTFLPTAAALALARHELVWHPGLWFGYLNGFLSFTAFLCMLRALRTGEALALVPVVRLNFAVTGALTVGLLGEVLNAERGAALVLAGLAILCGGGRYARAGEARRALGFALLSMVLFGLVGLFYKVGLRAGAAPAALATSQSLGFLCLAAPLVLLRRERLPRSGPTLWLPLLCGCLISLSYVALAVALLHGDAVVVVPIAQLSFVFTGILAVAFLGERLTTGKAIGVALAALAILLFALG